MLLFVASCVFFVVRCDKGICLVLFGMCNGCVVHIVIGFDVGGFPFTFGLFVVRLGNVGWIIGLCWALVITVVLSPIGGEAKLIGVLCPTAWRLDGIAQLFLSSNVST